MPVRECGDETARWAFRTSCFWEINRNIAPLLKLLEVGDIDWQRMLDDPPAGNFTKENLQHVITRQPHNMGGDLASAGIGRSR